MRDKTIEKGFGFGFSMIDQTILMINVYGRPLFIKQEIKNNVISFDVCLNKQWYFVTKIVLTYCEKKMFGNQEKL